MLEVGPTGQRGNMTTWPRECPREVQKRRPTSSVSRWASRTKKYKVTVTTKRKLAVY